MTMTNHKFVISLDASHVDRPFSQEEIAGLRERITDWRFQQKETLLMISTLRDSLKDTENVTKPTKEDIYHKRLTCRQWLFGSQKWIPQRLLISKQQIAWRNVDHAFAVIHWGNHWRLHIHKTRLLLDCAEKLILRQQELFNRAEWRAMDQNDDRGVNWSVVEKLTAFWFLWPISLHRFVTERCLRFFDWGSLSAIVKYEVVENDFSTMFKFIITEMGRMQTIVTKPEMPIDLVQFRKDWEYAKVQDRDDSEMIEKEYPKELELARKWAEDKKTHEVLAITEQATLVSLDE